MPPPPRDLAQVDELIARAKLLPHALPLRSAVLIDLGLLREAWLWITSQAAMAPAVVPVGAHAILGLTLAHLHARLIRCEERIGEGHRVPA